MNLELMREEKKKWIDLVDRYYYKCYNNMELNLSYLFISHDLDILSWFSDDIAVMKQGEFLEVGKKDSVLLQPQKEYTKQLIQAFSH